MKLSELLTEKNILIHFKAKDKKDALTKLVDKVEGISRNTILTALMEREALGSTGIGEGVAVPHVKLDSIESLVIIFGLSHKPVPFDAIDGEPCSFFFLVLGSSKEEKQDQYLKAMAKVSRLMRDEGFRSELLKVQSPAETIDLIKKYEA